jgi:hypothetical protein
LLTCAAAGMASVVAAARAVQIRVRMGPLP